MSRTVSAKLSKQIIEACHDIGHEIRNDYSGRCMYGERCFGIETDGKIPTDIIFFVAREYIDELAMEDVEDDTLEDLERVFQDMRSDSMGLGMIYYFPGWQLDEEVVAEYYYSEEEAE